MNKERIAAVTVIDARLSEGEIALYEEALGYLLDSLNAEEIEVRFGASSDEIEGMCDDLRVGGERRNRRRGPRDAGRVRLERQLFGAT